jgi:hypothetical protein
MAKAEITPSTSEQAAEPASKQKQLGKRYEQSIRIQQAQDVSLTMWASRLVRSVVARLRSGRPRDYNHDAITGVAEACIAIGVDDYLDRFVERVRNVCKLRHIQSPRDTVLTKICAPIYKREHAKIAKK